MSRFAADLAILSSSIIREIRSKELAHNYSRHCTRDDRDIDKLDEAGSIRDSSGISLESSHQFTLKAQCSLLIGNFDLQIPKDQSDKPARTYCALRRGCVVRDDGGSLRSCKTDKAARAVRVVCEP